MKKTKKFLAILLSMVMLMTTTMFNFAADYNKNNVPIDSKIVEQLKEDLGEEKAEEILNMNQVKSDSPVDEVEVDSSSYDNENVVEIDTEDDLSEVKNDVNETIKTKEPESTDNESIEFYDKKSLDNSLVDEYTDKNDIENQYNDNIDTNNNIISTESEIEIVLKSTKSNADVYGEDTPWMWWYLTDEDTTIHYTSVEPDSGGHGVSGSTFGIYVGLEEEDRIKKAIFDNKIIALDANNLFSGFKNLITIDNLNNFDISNVTGMHDMFFGCSSLTSIDVSNFNTSKVTNMGSMFSGCSSLTSIDVSSFDTSNVTTMNSMFSGCSSLTSIDVSSFNTSNVTNMGSIFDGCSSLIILNLSSFDIGNVTYMSYMFNGCSALTSIDVSSFDTGNVTGMSFMFHNCSSLTSIDINKFDTSKVTGMNSMFSGCSSLTSIDVSSFDTSNVTTMNSMFSGCSSLTSIDVSSFNTSNITSMSDMFSGCSSLTSIDVGNFVTSSVTDMARMFRDCSSIISLDVSSFDTSNVWGMTGMFLNCSNLVIIYANERFNTGNIYNADFYHLNMFLNCNKLVGGKGTKYNSTYVDKRYARVDGGPSSPGYFTYKSNTPVIEFNLNGHGEEILPLPIEKGEKIPKPTDPVEEGWTFGGWHKEAECKNAWDFDNDTVTGNTELFAKWTINTYTVTFDTNNIVTIDNQPVDYKNKVIKPVDPQVDGYKFINWYKDSEYKTVFDFNNELIINNITIYGKFIKIHTVTFVTNNKGVTGANNIDPIKVDDGTKVSRPTNDPSAQNYEFLGWYSDAKCTNEFDFDEPITADTEIYANWRAVVTYTITFNMNSHGTQVQPLYVVENKYATEPAKPTEEGYSFKYWY